MLTQLDGRSHPGPLPADSDCHQLRSAFSGRTVTLFHDVEPIRQAGFCGFIPIRELRVTRLRLVPEVMGVYLVLRLRSEPPVFVYPSPAGHFKGKDPTVSLGA